MLLVTSIVISIVVGDDVVMFVEMATINCNMISMTTIILVNIKRFLRVPFAGDMTTCACALLLLIEP